MVEGKVLRRAVFLDRDGTLNKDVGYVHRKEDWQWLPGVVDDASIVNSSPPKRAHMSEVRVLFFKMALTVCRAASPAWCP